MKRTIVLSIVVASILWSAGAAAQSWRSGVAEPGELDRWIGLAVDAEKQADYEAAADRYLQAAAFDPQLSRFLRYRALKALLAAPDPPSDRVEQLADGAVEWPYAGAADAAVRASAHRSGGLPDADVLATALETDDREMICEFLTAALQGRADEGLEFDAQVADLHHGYCSDTEVASFAAEPSPRARVDRADRLYGQVRFYASADELAKLGDLAELKPPKLACRAMFRKGRTLYRIRKRRNESEPAYRWVAEHCTSDDTRSLRKRALYAVGKRRFQLDDYDGAKPFFETLLADYSEASHADDAILYLARIARVKGNRNRELELMELAGREHADGDMYTEIVWEVLETHYKNGDWLEFIESVRLQKLPEHDDHYYSQGRLDYFVGQALLKMNKKEKAVQTWKETWLKYPFSFYGYLSRVRLVKAGAVAPVLDVDPDAVPGWLDTPRWRVGALGRLFRAGNVDLAVDYAASVRPESNDDRWRIAYVYDEAGEYPVSHNIVRRQIEGRPWGEPIDARLVQWRLAWPDPFGPLVEQATTAEAQQTERDPVDPALPRAIMREESSFIEDIESYAGALGLMQLMPRTALGHDADIEGEASPDRLKTAEVNVRVGVDHLFWLSRRFKGHPVLMVAAYNAGSGNIDRWLRQYGSEDPAIFIEDLPVLQTRNYTKRVIGSYAAYQWLSGRPGLDDRVVKPTR